MTPFADLQSFVVKHTDAKYFKSDLKLYKKCFPQSRLITELDRAPEFAKKGLDERMCTEILQHPDMCIDTVWENRGKIRDAKENLVELPKKEIHEINKQKQPKPIKADIKNIDISKLKYNELKRLVFDFNLDEQCNNHKAETYRAVLKKHFSVPTKTEDKKKEGHDPNTQK